MCGHAVHKRECAIFKSSAFCHHKAAVYHPTCLDISLLLFSSFLHRDASPFSWSVLWSTMLTVVDHHCGPDWRSWAAMIKAIVIYRQSPWWNMLTFVVENSANHIDCMNLLQMFNNWSSDLSCRPTTRQMNLNLHLMDWHTAESSYFPNQNMNYDPFYIPRLSNSTICSNSHFVLHWITVNYLKRKPMAFQFYLYFLYSTIWQM